MNALDKIMENVDLIKLLEHYGFKASHQEGTILRSPCMIHGGNNPSAFAFNVENGLWFCHTGDCGGGDVITLIEKMEGYSGKSSFPNAVKFLAAFFDVDITELEIIERKLQSQKEVERFMKLMRGRKKIPIEEYALPSDAKLVTKFRDFQLNTLQHFQLAFIDEIELIKRNGDAYTLYDRLVIPIWFKEIVIGMSLRRTKSKDYPKWSHQPANLKTSDTLYNYDSVKNSPIIIVCEGMFDVWAFHEIGIPAVCTFGANISDKQYKLLMKTGADLVFAYDGDDVGKKATSKAMDMFKYKANLFKIDFSEGQDPASITREELLYLYENRQRGNY